MQDLDRKTWGKNSLADLGVDGLTALKLALKNWDHRMWNGFVLLSRRTCGEILSARLRTFWLHEIHGISWITEGLLASARDAHRRSSPTGYWTDHPFNYGPGTDDNTRSCFSYWLNKRCSCVRRQAPCLVPVWTATVRRMPRVNSESAPGKWLLRQRILCASWQRTRSKNYEGPNLYTIWSVVRTVLLWQTVLPRLEPFGTGVLHLNFSTPCT
jgi:hypothetical protein